MGRPPGWRNWFTRWTQNPLSARACGFESRPGHLTIRAATRDDARAIAEVHVASWRAGYRGLVDDDFLAALSVDARLATWETLLVDET